MVDMGPAELIIVLVIVVLVFGPGRLAKTLGEIGKSNRSFRDLVQRKVGFCFRYGCPPEVESSRE